MGHLRWGHEVLRDPRPDDLRRRRLVPIDRFNDDDIACMDAENWRSLDGYYRARSDEREHLQRLQVDMEENGIFRHVEIGAWGNSLFVADGHHRVQTARALGWTHLPYRWFRRERQVFSGPIRWESGTLPGVPEVATLTSLLAGSILLVSYVATQES